MAYSGRFVAENELVNGLCKLILDDDDRVIGCHMLGNPVSELIVLAGLAVQHGYTVKSFKRLFFRIRRSVKSSMKLCLRNVLY